ncbi:MAG: iron chelate uptake ABC transporter family permease subunit [Phycisphaerales bacterium]
MEQFIRLLTLQDANTRVVLAGVIALGVAAGVVGCFAVLRRRALAGDAAAHAALPGVCAAYFVVGERHFGVLLVGAMVFSALAMGFISLVKAATRIKEDAATALAIGGFFGLGIVLSRIIQNQPSGNRAGLDGFIFGKAAGMVADDSRLVTVVSVGLIGVTALLFKEFRLLSFDRDFARGQGWPTLALDLLLMGMVCACTVVGLPAVGVVMIVALLVVPAAAARFWTDRLGRMVVLSGVFGGGAAAVGASLSAIVPSPAGSISRGWPTGPMVVLVAGAIFAVSFLLAPGRGIVCELVRRSRMRRRIAVQNLLRDAYEWSEEFGGRGRSWRPWEIARDGLLRSGTVRRTMRSGLVARSADGYVLTERGWSEAARLVRTHRLWELYLIEHAQIAADHVDRDADQIEHVLSSSLMTRLEATLRERGLLPGGDEPHEGAVPESPHPTGKRSAGRVLPLMLAAFTLFHGASQVRADGVGPEGVVGQAEPARPLAQGGEAAGLQGADPMSRRGLVIGSYELRADDYWIIATAVCCSIGCGVLGCFLVLRGMSLIGDAISHAILPGLAGAFLLTQSRSPVVMLAGALVVGVMTALLAGALSRRGRVKEDAALGVVFTTLFALGVLMITMAAGNVDLDPGCVLYGLIELVPFETVSVAGLEAPRSLIWLSVTLAVNLLLIVVFYKELKVVCFDPALATAMGLSAGIVNLGLLTAVAATCVASFEAVGSILVVAMLVAPGATAQLLTDRLSRMLWWSAAVAAVAATTGYAAAVWLNTSVAGMIATVSLAIFVLVVVASPTHGVVARRLRSGVGRGGLGERLGRAAS